MKCLTVIGVRLKQRYGVLFLTHVPQVQRTILTTSSNYMRLCRMPIHAVQRNSFTSASKHIHFHVRLRTI
jgi:hypothetical protein